MRRLLAWVSVLVMLAACTGAVPESSVRTVPPQSTATTGPGPTSESSPDATPIATTVAATAGTASAEPGKTTDPNATPEPTPEPTAVASVPPLVRPDLRYQLVEGLGRPLYCDPDFYPVQRMDEADQARLYIAAIRGDAPTFAAIIAQLRIEPAISLTDAQTLAIYREWKMLRALGLSEAGDRFGFDYVAADETSDTAGWHVVGTIDTGGSIAVDRRDPSGPPPCPICLARGTWISTPDGPRRVEDLRVGTPVWTSDVSGARLMGQIVEVGSTPVPSTHEVVHLVLSDARTVAVSPGHPLPDGRLVGDLRRGDHVDGSIVASAALVSYGGGATFDLLPSGPTGTYWANGILLGSTLAADR